MEINVTKESFIKRILNKIKNSSFFDLIKDIFITSDERDDMVYEKLDEKEAAKYDAIFNEGEGNLYERFKEKVAKNPFKVNPDQLNLASMENIQKPKSTEFKINDEQDSERNR